MKTQIEIPENCPVCDSQLTLIEEQLFCINKSCPAVLNKNIKHFVTTIGIKGFGDKTIERLDLSNITDIYKLDIEGLTDKLSSGKLAEKLLIQIQNSEHVSLDKAIACFGIPLIGKTAASKLTSIVKSMDYINEQACEDAGLGEKATVYMMDFMNNEYQYYKEHLPFLQQQYAEVVEVPQREDNEVCITGKLLTFANKEVAAEELKKLGFKVVANVTKTTSFLVDELNSSSLKRKKADSLGTVIIYNLNNFIKEIKNVQMESRVNRAITNNHWHRHPSI